MLLARVKGLVVATQKVESLAGFKLRMIQPVDGADQVLGVPWSPWTWWPPGTATW